jgi:hypothetical protein
MWPKISLPAAARPGVVAQDTAHADLARREYEEELSKLLRQSGFDAGSFTIVPKPPDSKSGPTLANKKPIYTRLEFAVQLKGDLASLVDWMERFYKLRLLHQIRNLSIQRPVDSARNANTGDLDINMTIEALVLDTAEVRKTLVPDKPPELPPLLTPGRQYASIAGKNVFFGPPPAAPKSDAIDATPYVKFESTTSSEGGLAATLWDAVHNHDYEIRPRSVGGYRVEVYYYINNRKRSLRSGGDALELRNEDGDVEHRWQIVRVEDRELILREKDKYYSLHIGEALADMKELSKGQLSALGIKAEPAAKASAPAEDLDKD